LPREIEHQLSALLGTRAAGKIQDPVRMLPVEIGIGVDHFGLDPEAKVHAE
jgi:hypothetical protein